MAKPLLCTLDEIEGTDLNLVGGKAFRLAILRQHAINVPPGLVLTTAFFESQLQHCQLIPLWAGSPDVAVTTESLDWLASTLKIRPLAPSLLRELQAKLTAVFGPDTDKFAVRSSAIDEDQRDHTFAGIHLTELGVPRSALAIAITRCWASALSQPAIKLELPEAKHSEAVRQQANIVYINSAGEVYLNDEPMEVALLGEALSQRMEETDDRSVIMKADSRVSHGAVVEVLDIIKSIGVRKLVISTKVEQ